MFLRGPIFHSITITILIGGLNLVQAQSTFSITRPRTGEVLTAGTTYNILWTSSTYQFLSIELFNNDGIPVDTIFSGTECDGEAACGILVNNVTNTGSFLWNIPANAPPNNSYSLDIFVPSLSNTYIFAATTGDFSIQQGTFESVSVTPSITSVSISSSATSTGTSTGPSTTSISTIVRETVHPKCFLICSTI